MDNPVLEVFMWDRFGPPNGPVAFVVELLYMFSPIYLIFRAMEASRHTLTFFEDVCPDPGKRDQALALWVISAFANLAFTKLYLTWSKTSLRFTKMATLIQVGLAAALFLFPESEYSSDLKLVLVCLSVAVPCFHQSLIAQFALQAEADDL